MDASDSSISAPTSVHRIGGASLENLRLKSKERTLDLPGISVFLGGTPQEAAQLMRTTFPNATRLSAAAEQVATSTVGEIWRAGFDIFVAPTRYFPNHARLIHADGAIGFSDENLLRLAQVFRTTTGT